MKFSTIGLFLTIMLLMGACRPKEDISLESHSSVSFHDALDSAKAYFGLGNSDLHASLKLSAHDSIILYEAFLKSMTGKNNQTNEENKWLYGKYEPFTVAITHLLNLKAGLSWGSYSHTGIPVAVFAKGVGEDAFHGFYDNTDIAKKIIEIAKFQSSKASPSRPKYIFLFIGDGMAWPQIQATEAFLSHINEQDSSNRVKKNLQLTQLPVCGMATTQAYNRYITGSAAAGTALATGFKTSIGTISKAPDHSGNYETIAEMAKSKGMKVGIISSVSIDHATPACFYAHEPSRDNYNNIALQMATSGFDFFGGGFARGEFERSKSSDPEGDAKSILDVMKEAGYKIANTKAELNSTKPGQKCWAYSSYDADGALAYSIDRKETDISLAEFTSEAIRLLDHQNGFFVMVEGGKIDWACHANDASSAIHDVISFDEAIEVALQFQQSHPKETLIVATGDHECGALSLGHATTKYNTAFEILAYQKLSFELFTEKVNSWKSVQKIN